MDWKKIDDTRIRHVWADDSGVEHYISPWFYADAGIPIDEESGDDMTYLHTELLVATPPPWYYGEDNEAK